MRLNRSTVFLKTFLFAILIALNGSCGSDDPERKTERANPESQNTEAKGSIAEIVAANSNFSTLLAAVDAAELTATLSSDGPFTVFAPTDAAFAKLDKDTLSALLEPANKAKLTKILLHHVVSGKYEASDVLSKASLTSVMGQKLVVDESGPSVGSSTITSTNIKATNGVIHVVDTVIIPSDIAAVAQDSGFSTLVAALQAGGLVDTIKNDGPFTVFAPTNAAFAALPDGTLDNLLLPENKDQLVSILTYHVVSGSYSAKDVLSQGSLTTLNGKSLDFSSNSSGAKINSASNITTVDIPALNGTIHVIDSVLLP